MADRGEARRELKLGDPVRFSRQMAGFRVPLGGGWVSYAKTKDPTDGYRTPEAIARAREIAGDIKFGHFRVVVSWEPKPRQDYDLLNKHSGIIVGKTFRYEGIIEYEDGCLIGVGGTRAQRGEGGPYTYRPAVRVPCWEVKQTLNRKAVLVPIDAAELIPVCPACGERAEHFDQSLGVDGEWTCITVQYGACRTFRA